jgi:Phosphotransferase enzyme family
VLQPALGDDLGPPVGTGFASIQVSTSRSPSVSSERGARKPAVCRWPGRPWTAGVQKFAGRWTVSPVRWIRQVMGAPGEMICHGDFGPWNGVWHGERIAALIDVDHARPAPPIFDIACALEYAAPFRDNAELA